MITESTSVAWIFTGDRGRYEYDHARFITDSSPRQLLRTIAVQLARIPRYVGATIAAWPVGAHAFAVSRLATILGAAPLVALRALHHDDHEVVTQDLPGPLRRWITRAVERGELDPAARWYEQACIEAQLEVEERLGIARDPEVTADDAGEALIRRCDQLVLEAERRLLHNQGPLSTWAIPADESEIQLAITCVRDVMHIALVRECVEIIDDRYAGRSSNLTDARAFDWSIAPDALLVGPRVRDIADSYVVTDQLLRWRAGLPELG